MGRNAAFGRPQAQDRLQAWWYAKSARRLNTVLIGLVGAAVLGLLLAALSKDATRRSPLANATRPQLTPATVVITTSPSTSTTVEGDLVAAGMGTATNLFGLSSTTTSSIAVAATVPAPPRGATPVTAATTATTTPRAPGTTVVNPDVVYSEVPTPPTTTAPATTTPVATTAPPPPTTTPPATTTPTTASTAITLPLGLPPLVTP